MRIGVLGSGPVGRTIATALVDGGHEVVMGTREPADPAGPARTWAAQSGRGARAAGFSETARDGEVLFNCLHGSACVDVLGGIDPDSLADKVLIDPSNDLDFSGPVPVVAPQADGSLGERIQRRCPGLKVVKALNTVTARVMVEPAALPGRHDLLICGDDAWAKEAVAGHLSAWFGWSSVIDLGNLAAARAMESYIGLWIALRLHFGASMFNIRVVREGRL